MFFLKRRKRKKKKSQKEKKESQKEDGILELTNDVYVESYLYMKFHNFVIKKHVKSYVNRYVLFDTEY